MPKLVECAKTHPWLVGKHINTICLVSLLILFLKDQGIYSLIAQGLTQAAPLVALSLYSSWTPTSLPDLPTSLTIRPILEFMVYILSVIVQACETPLWILFPVYWGLPGIGTDNDRNSAAKGLLSGCWLTSQNHPDGQDRQFAESGCKKMSLKPDKEKEWVE